MADGRYLWRCNIQDSPREPERSRRYPCRRHARRGATRRRPPPTPPPPACPAAAASCARCRRRRAAGHVRRAHDRRWVAEEIETPVSRPPSWRPTPAAWLPGAEGPSEAIRFPLHGPSTSAWATPQAAAHRPSVLPSVATPSPSRPPASKDLLEYTGHGLFRPYREKTRAGLDMARLPRQSRCTLPLPYRAYADFAAVPPRRRPRR